MSQKKIEKIWRDAIERIFYSPGLIENYLKATQPAQARSVAKRLARLDEDLARVQARADAAFLLIGDENSPGVSRQARAQLEKIDRDEMAIHAQRQALLSEQLPQRERSIEIVREALAAYDELYDGATVGERNRLNRELVALLGYPVLERVRDTRRGPVLMRWAALARPVQTAPENRRPANRPKPKIPASADPSAEKAGR